MSSRFDAVTVIVAVKDFGEICRTCLRKEILIPILGSSTGELKTTDLLQQSLSIDLDNKNLPQNICMKCLNYFYQVYEFKKQCSDIENILKALLKTSKSDNIESTVEDFEDDNIESTVEDFEDDKIESTVEDFEDDNIESTVEDFEDDKIESTVEDFKGDITITEDDVKQNYQTNTHNNNLIKNVKNESESNDLDVTSNSEGQKSFASKKTTINCRQCGYIASSVFDLHQHRKTAQHVPRKYQGRIHKCEICDKIFPRYKLSEHMRTHTKEQPFQCEFCYKRFNCSRNLIRHKGIHTGVRRHVCNICKKSFNRSDGLRKHVKIHEYESMNDVNLQKETFGSAIKFKCEHCGLCFKRLGSLKAHMQKHTEKCDESETVNESRDHMCDVCGRSYSTKFNLQNHMLKHGEKSFLCNVCGNRFFTKWSLQCHLVTHSDKRPYVCTICSKSFARIPSLDKHMLIHYGIKPHKCHLCSKSFTQSTHLICHLRTHSGEKLYSCTMCEKRFALRGNLTVHMRTHTGETPYLCSLCGKGFYYSSSMKKHVKKHEKAESDERAESGENNSASSDVA